MAVDQWVVRKSQRSRSRPAHHASPRAPSPLASRSATHQGRFPDQNVRSLVRSLVAARATVGVLVTTFAQRRSHERRRTAAHARASVASCWNQSVNIGCECESLGVFPARAGPAGSGHQRPEQKFEVSAGHFHRVVSTTGKTRLFKIEMRVWDVHSSRQDGNLRSVLTDTTLTVTVRETDESYTQVLAPV